MSSIDKLKNKLLKVPADFKYSELKRLLEAFGYNEDTGGKSSGSCVNFTHHQYDPIAMHKPHPGDEVKRYVLRKLIDALKERGQL